MGRLEVACFNAESALLAAATGAHRIELCSDRASGGITAPLTLLQDLRSKIPINIPINVMIRPRGGSFVYSKIELDEMISSLNALKPYCDGFVFGILKADSTVDVEQCVKLVKLADPLPCTFHRAFDETPDALKALDDVAVSGFKTILTSGGPGNAVSNIEGIRHLLHATSRETLSTRELIVMVGGGLRNKDMITLQRHGVKPDWYHTSAIVDGGEIADKQELVACRIQVEDSF